MNKPKIQVILGSIRKARNGDKVARWFMEVAKKVTGAEVELVDLLDYPLPLFDDATGAKSREAGKHPNPAVQKWLQKLNAADGYVVITAEYNHSVPGALKNALDFPYNELVGKPVGFVSYGGVVAGSRAVEHLRQIVEEFKMHAVRDQVLIPNVFMAFDEGGTMKNPELLEKSAITMLEDVVRLVIQLKK